MTVIDGLAGAGSMGPRHTVLVAKGTYPDHYESADVIEYDAGAWVPPTRERLDALGARLGIGRPFRAPAYRRAMQALPDAPTTLLLHNAPFTGSLAPSRAAPVLYAHNDVLPGPRWAVARAVAGLEGIVAVSSWLADRLQARLPRRLRHRVLALVNGVDTQAFTVPDRPERETARILFLGRVVPQKGPDLLLESLTRLRPRPFEVRIVGSQGFAAEGPLSAYETSLRRLAGSLESVEFLPFRTRAQVPEQFAWADVVVLPARWHEPCGLTLLEAMASGAATVISDSGGMPEAAGDGAVVVPRGDVSALTDALAALLDDPAERRALGLRGRLRAEALDWRSRARRLDETLRAWGVPSG